MTSGPRTDRLWGPGGIDGPTWNECPGEALTPGEAFLATVAACGVELVEVIAHDDGVRMGRVRARIQGIADRKCPVREDLTVFNAVTLEFELEGGEPGGKRRTWSSAPDVAVRSTAASLPLRRSWTCRSGSGDRVEGDGG